MNMTVTRTGHVTTDTFTVDPHQYLTVTLARASYDVTEFTVRTNTDGTVDVVWSGWGLDKDGLHTDIRIYAQPLYRGISFKHDVALTTLLAATGA